MIRVLQIVDSVDLGGIQSFIMNMYRQMVKYDVQFDFMVFHQRKQFFEDDIIKLGGKIYKLPSRRDGIIKTRNALKKFFVDHNYRVVHYEASSLSFLDPLEMAYKAGIPVRIIHSHSTNAPGNKLHCYIHKLNKKRIYKIATHYFACGNLAAKWMFGKTECENTVKLVNNGIDVSQFTYNEKVRRNMRTLLHIDKAFVIGQVGRISDVKNHMYTLKVFKEILRLNSSERNILLVVGDGKLRKNIEDEARKLGLKENVIFLGARKDIPELMQVMDAMIMPSFYEGFPVTAIEGQAAGLPCFISDTVTKDALLKSNAFSLSIEAQPSEWARKILENRTRDINNKILIDNGFDVNHTVKQLLLTYEV